MKFSINVLTLVAILFLFGCAFERHQYLKLNHALAIIKAEAIASNSEVLTIASEAENIIQELQATQAAYDILFEEYDLNKLIRHNQPIVVIKPTLDKINRTRNNNNLEELERRLNSISNQSLDKIKAAKAVTFR